MLKQLFTHVTHIIHIMIILILNIYPYTSIHYTYIDVYGLWFIKLNIALLEPGRLSTALYHYGIKSGNLI